MRMTQNKRAVLAQLPCEGGEALSASSVALLLDKRMSDVARTLRHLEAQGFIISETHYHRVRRKGFGISVRKLKCYCLAPGITVPAEHQ